MKTYKLFSLAVLLLAGTLPVQGQAPFYSHPFPEVDSTAAVTDTVGDDPEPEHGPFCGAVGTEGCDAIHADSSAIVAWATGCTLVRGPIKIENASGALASFGDSTNAVGPATTNNTMDAVSLGDGGSATLTFAHPIRNGEGPDFAVFENGIVSNITNNAFLELAFVEVSSDGERFVRFPATSLTPTETQVGSFGEVDPTMINNLAGKYQIGYGTPFDLEELRDSAGINIDSIVYVRVVDVVGTVDPQYASYDAEGRIVNDPYPTQFNSCGYDLTGVAVMYERIDTTQPMAIDPVAVPAMALYPNPATDILHVVSLESGVEAVLYDISGRAVRVMTLVEGRNTLDVGALPAGVYVLRAQGSVYRVVKR